MLRGSASTSRLTVTHIVAENFKSYAGRQTIGPFHPSFTSIVGPNGSGKSNVIDAFMFVLGYRAKRLRQGKLADLIHNSVEGGSVADSCSVHVHFSTGGGDAGTLVVSRQVWRSGKSQYYVNGQTCGAGEVADVLRQHGFDPEHKRFLILQGEVESIALMKPKGVTESEEGLLEYLEEIIGSNRLVGEIEKATRVAVELAEKCQEKLVLVKAAEKACNALEPKKKEAMRFVRLENELVMTRADLFQAQIYRSKKEMIDIEPRVSSLRGKHEAMKTEHSADIEKHDQMEQELRTAIDAMTKAERESEKLTRQITAIEKTDIQLRAKRDELKKKLDALKRGERDAQKSHREAEDELSKTIADLQSVGFEISELEKQRVKAEAELGKIGEGLRGMTEGLQQQLERMQVELAPWNHKIRKQQEVVDMLSTELEMDVMKIEAGRSELEKAKVEFEKTQAEMTDLTAQKEDLLSVRAQVHAQSDKLQLDARSRREKRTKLHQEINLLGSTIAEAQESVQEEHSDSALLVALMKEASSGRIKGIQVEDLFLRVDSVIWGQSIQSLMLPSLLPATSWTTLLLTQPIQLSFALSF